jgi:hypothetical protein
MNSVYIYSCTKVCRVKYISRPCRKNKIRLADFVFHNLVKYARFAYIKFEIW